MISEIILLNRITFIFITVRSGYMYSFSYENTGAAPKIDNGLDIFLIVTIKRGFLTSFPYSNGSSNLYINYNFTVNFVPEW